MAGDALITRPWSQVRDAAFLELIEAVRRADVAIANLETLIHEFKGHPQANAGGSYLASPPHIADELKWAGFDMLAHANNHTFDYGSIAVLETLEHTERAGLIVAGSGKDLQAARAPRYFQCQGGTVALVAMAATFVEYGRASRSRPDMHGRPGLNPLSLTFERAVLVPSAAATGLRTLGRLLGKPREKLTGSTFRVGGMRFRVDDRYGYVSGLRAVEADLEANLDAISEAARNADVVVASVHAHRQGPWLEKFADQAIERGADVVFVHGPHRVGAVELRSGKPVFYCLGDFAFEVEHIMRFPADEYDRWALGDEATVNDLSRANRILARLLRDRAAFEGFAAVLSIADGRTTRIRLLPVDLQFDADSERRGRPQMAGKAAGEPIIGSVAAASKRHGTRIRYDAEANCGEVELD